MKDQRSKSSLHPEVHPYAPDNGPKATCKSNASVIVLRNVALIVQSNTRLRLSSSSSLSGAIGTLDSGFSSWGIGIIVGLVWAVNCDLNSNFTALNLLSIHLLNGLLLLLLLRKSDETEATALAGFVAGLELLDHETGNWAKGDLSGGWLICSEKFLELLLREIVWQVCDHNLSL